MSDEYQAVVRIVRAINRRTGKGARSMQVAMDAYLHDRTARLWLNRLEDAGILYRRSERTGWYVYEK